jgi:valyl-tRNA synthetase
LRGTRHTLITVLEQLLRLMHPVMPFITEEIWQRVAPLAGISAKTIMLQAYPKASGTLRDTASEQELEWIKSLIVAIRTIRSEMNIAPGKPLSVLLRKGTAQDKTYFANNKHLIMTLASLADTNWLSENDAAPESATALIGELEILIPMAGLIDKKEESARLNREISKLAKEAERAEAKLQNPSFVDRAPADVVDKERSKLDELKATLVKLEQQLEKISVM